jgi:hypothetical protein
MMRRVQHTHIRSQTMNRRSVLSRVAAIAAMFIMTIAGIIAGSNSATAQTPPGSTPCDITSWWPWGSGCHTWCPPGTACQGSAGFFGTDCKCVPYGAPPPPAHFIIVPLTPQHLMCAQQLKMYLQSLGRPDAMQLAAAIDFCINANQSGDDNMYTAAENNFISVYGITPPDLKELMQNWLAMHPECGMN